MVYHKIKHKGYCLNCGKPISIWLRIDSKFCSDKCKVDWFRYLKSNFRSVISVTRLTSKDDL